MTYTVQLYRAETGAQIKWAGTAKDGAAARRSAVAANPGFRVLSVTRWEA